MTSALRTVSSGATQTTQIEQARAVADVLAAVEAAKRWPRDEDAAERRMVKSCQRRLVADRAFWSFPRSGETLTGPTIDLARTVGAIWTNFQWGISELGRDDGSPTTEGMSTMIAWAWDLETNTRASTSFLVPHARDTKRGRQRLGELRDVYENNANQGARRVREMIFGLLPDWYVETAVETCRGVVEGQDEPIEKLRAETGKLLQPLGVDLSLVLARVGRTAWAETTRGDLATLRIIAKTISRGEGTVRELFPDPTARVVPAAAERVTRDELTGRPATPTTLSETAAPATPPEPEKPDEKQTRRMHALFGEAEVTAREDRLHLTGLLLGGRKVDTSAKLTKADVAAVIDALVRLKGSGHPRGLTGAVDDLLNAEALREESEQHTADDTGGAS